METFQQKNARTWYPASPLGSLARVASLAPRDSKRATMSRPDCRERKIELYQKIELARSTGMMMYLIHESIQNSCKNGKHCKAYQ